MKKIILTLLVGLSLSAAQAQNFGKINEILDRLEQRKGFNQNLGDVDLNGKKFIAIKDFEDHTERQFIIFNQNKVNYIEVFDDKKTQKTTSNVFSGDMMRTKKNVISIRADLLEGEKIPIPITKTLWLNKEKNILYLIDINTKERWIDQTALNKQ
ncbi:hypothetical protein [Riemerella columbina]|uniref:hypothetical protein n=1 Tax=Riemerella columbina TaxID=103810 RepID=UPI00266FEEE7|nr:hypothetical protein [Riemerella columbina]WKS94830.1 hypothetical protein NYR17_07820 [Riemerella columbina]